MAIRGGYAKGDRSKETILDAAVELFGLNGYMGTSLRDVARHSGLTHSGLLHHFPNKSSLLTAVIARKDREEHERITEQHSKTVVPLDAFMGMLTANQERPELIRLFTMLSAEATNTEHPAHSYFLARYRQINHIVDGSLQGLKAAGLLRPDLNTGATAKMISALMDGIQLQWLIEGGDETAQVDMPTVLAEFFKLLTTASNSEVNTDEQEEGDEENEATN